MSTERRFIWEEKFSVGVKELDEQHRQFFAIGNEVLSLLEKKDLRREDVLLQVTKFGDYVMFHLDTEEGYLRKFDCAVAAEHIKAHDEFRAAVSGFFLKLREKDSDFEGIAQQMADFAVGWYGQHILIMDKKYTECFHKNGLW